MWALRRLDRGLIMGNNKGTLHVSGMWNRNQFREVPLIRLKGIWLEHLGFHVGDDITLEFNLNGEVVIKKIYGQTKV